MEKNSSLRKEYEKVCRDYAKAFCNMYGYDYDEKEWVEIGGVYEIGDMFVNFDDIRYIVDNEVPSKMFYEWYDYTTRLGFIDISIPTPNLKSWCMGCPRKSDEEIRALEESHMRLIQLQKEFKCSVDDFKDTKGF